MATARSIALLRRRLWLYSKLTPMALTDSTDPYQALVKSFGGGPAGLSTLAVAVGEEPETVESVVEPFLVRKGLMMRTPRGRVATVAAWEYFGLSPVSGGIGANTTRAGQAVLPIGVDEEG